MLDLILILINLKLESFLKKYLAPAVRHKLLALWDRLNLFPFDDLKWKLVKVFRSFYKFSGKPSCMLATAIRDPQQKTCIVPISSPYRAKCITSSSYKAIVQSR